jgi:anaerobic selenocysteine-containing dehydrogenase
MPNKTRRDFLTNSAKFIAGSAALAAGGVIAASHEHDHGAAGEGMAVDAAAKDTCGTCQYWGGMRKISKDKKQVTAQSMGWCNNPDSMNYQKLTTADHMMKKPGIWKKWTAI